MIRKSLSSGVRSLGLVVIVLAPLIALCESATSQPAPEPPASTTPASKWAVVAFNNGTMVEGVILEESGTSLKMEVRLLNITSVVTYAKSDILSISRGATISPAQPAATQPSAQKGSTIVARSPVIVRASAVPSPSTNTAWQGTVVFSVSIACQPAFDDLIVRGAQVQPGHSATFAAKTTVESTVQWHAKGNVEHSVSRKMGQQSFDDLVRSGLGLRIFAQQDGRFLEGTLVNGQCGGDSPRAAARGDGEVERMMSIEWRAPPVDIGLNAVFLTLFGDRYEALAAGFGTASSTISTAISEAETLLELGLPIACSHCGGDGQLTSTDVDRFTREEQREYDLKVSAALANVQYGSVTRTRIRVQCSLCHGQGIAAHKMPTAALSARLREFTLTLSKVHESVKESEQSVSSMLHEWRTHPEKSPDLADQTTDLEKLKARYTESMTDIQRCLVLYDEILTALKSQ